MEAVEQVIDGTLDYGNSVSSTISRNGDLIRNMYVKYSPGDLSFRSHRYESDPNHTHSNIYIDFHKTGDGVEFADKAHIYPRLSCGLLKEIQIEIGGQEIDRHYAHWLSVREDLFEENEMGTVKGDSHLAEGDYAWDNSILPNVSAAFGEYPQTKFQKLTSETLL